jgi:hypothetical protein
MKAAARLSSRECRALPHSHVPLLEDVCEHYQKALVALRTDVEDEACKEADAVRKSRIYMHRFEANRQQFIRIAQQLLEDALLTESTHTVGLRDAIAGANSLLCTVFGDRKQVGGTLSECLQRCVAASLRLSSDDDTNWMCTVPECVLKQLEERWSRVSEFLQDDYQFEERPNDESSNS